MEKETATNWLFRLGLIFNLLLIFQMILRFFNMIGGHISPINETVLEWMGIYDPYNESYSFFYDLSLLISFFLSIIFITVGNVIKEIGFGRKRIIYSIFSPIGMIILCLLSFGFFLFLHSQIDPDQPRLLGQTYGVTRDGVTIVVQTMLSISFFMILTIPLFLVGGKNKFHFSFIKKISTFIFSLFLLCMLFTIADLYSNNPEYLRDDFLNNQMQALLIVSSVLIFFSYSDAFFWVWDNLGKKYENVNYHNGRKRIIGMSFLIISLFFTIVFIFGMELFFMKGLETNYGDRGSIILLVIEPYFWKAFVPVILAIFFMLAYQYTRYRNTKNQDGSSVNNNDPIGKVSIWEPVCLILFSITILISGFALMKLGMSLEYDSLNMNLPDTMGTFLTGVGIILSSLSLIISILFWIFLYKYREEDEIHFQSISRTKSFLYWYLSGVKGIYSWLSRSILSEENFKKWWIRGNSLLLLGIAFWGINITLEQTDLIHDFEWHSTPIGLYGALYVSCLFLFPLSLARLFLTEGNRVFKSKEAFISLALSLFLVFVISAKIGPYEIINSTYSYYRYYTEIVQDDIWILFVPIFTLVIAGIPISRIPKMKRLFLTIVVLLIFLSITYILNTHLGSILENQDGTFETEYMPFLWVLLPLVFLLLYPSVIQLLSGNDTNRSKPHSSGARNEPLPKRVRKLFQRYMEIAPFAIIIILIPISYTAVQYDNWHNYSLEKDLPEQVDMDFSMEFLSMNFTRYLGSDRTHLDSIHYPGFVNWSILKIMEKWMEENEKNKEWGNYRLYYSIDVIRGQTLSIVFTEMEDPYSYYRESDPIYDLQVSGLFGNFSSQYEYMNSIYLDIDDLGRTFYDDDGSINYTWPLVNFTDKIDGVDLIHLELDIGEQTAPLCGYGSYIDQYIGVKEGKIVFIHWRTSQWIS